MKSCEKGKSLLLKLLFLPFPCVMMKFTSGSIPKFLTERILNCFGILLATRPIQASKILDTLQVLTFPHHF